MMELNKTLNYIRNNWKWIITSIVVGLSITLWVIPYILSISWIKSFLKLTPSPTLFLLYTISLLFLSFIYKRLHDILVRHRNNFKLREIPFTYIDFFAWCFCSFSFSIICIEILVVNIPISIEVRLWIVIWFLFLCCYIIYQERKVKLQILPKPINQKVPDGIYLTDEPITNESQDILDRKKFVEDLYKQIIDCQLQDSFVFGIFGKWGEGKTSVINLLKNKLIENDRVMVFKFDPWYFSSEDKLIENFYEGLYLSLNSKFFLPNIRRDFIKYEKILTSTLKLSGINLDIKVDNELLDDIKRKIENWISITEKKIVIIIDNIDRLKGKNEILQIFKLVKLSGNFKNTIFILSFDLNIVSSYFKEELIIDLEYLNKIIQNPIHLPAIEQSSIDKFLDSKIDRLFKNLEISQDRIETFRGQFYYLYETHIKRLFPTLRHAKRYINSLNISLSPVKNGVNLHDFLILEIIRIFYPEIYDDIWEHRWYYLGKKGPYSPFAFSPLAFANEDEKYQKIKEHIDNIIKNQNESEILLELLKSIFTEVENAFLESKISRDAMLDIYMLENKITHPDVFPRYFMLKVPSTEILRETVENLINLWNNTDIEKLESQIISDLKNFQKDKKLIELLRKLNIFLTQQNKIHTIKVFIRSLYKNINIFSKETQWFSEFVVNSVIIHLINKKLPVNEIEAILVEIIKETPSFELAVLIIDNCSKNGRDYLFNIYENIKIENLQQVISDRLTKYFIEGKKDIFIEEKDSCHFILYQWGTYDKQEKKKVNDYVFSLIEKNHNYIGKIINYFAQTQNMYDYIIKLYDENLLYKKANEHSSDAYSTQDEKLAIDKFKKDFEEKEKSVRDKANQDALLQNFLKYRNESFKHFDEQRYKEALESCENALKISKDFRDEENYKDINLIIYRKWQCLLELAHNKEKEPIKEYFDKACNTADTELRIKKLADDAFPNELTITAYKGFYYCLFYFLKWYFAEEKKDELIEIFKNYYDIATGDHTSGHSEEITNRCKKLWGRIYPKT